MSLQTHFTSILEKHGKLEQIIATESARPSPDFGLLQTLKKQKLLLKEELERLRLQASRRMDAA